MDEPRAGPHRCGDLRAFAARPLVATGARRASAHGHMSSSRRHSPREEARHRDDNLLHPDAALVAALEEAAPGAVAARASDRLGFAHDASHYLLTPQAVVTPRPAPQA